MQNAPPHCAVIEGLIRQELQQPLRNRTSSRQCLDGNLPSEGKLLCDELRDGRADLEVSCWSALTAAHGLDHIAVTTKVTVCLLQDM